MVAVAGLLATPGCSSGPTASVEPKPVKLAKTAKVAVIRLGDPLQEPSDADISDGIRAGGVDVSSFVIEGKDAKGDAAAVPGLIDAAVADGASVVMTLLPETTLAAVGKDLKVPLVFMMTGEPFVLGLGTSNTEHPPNLTGAYTPFVPSDLGLILQRSLPKASKLGVPFNPDDRYSVIHKDALLKSGLPGFELLTAEFHSDSEVPAAVRSLIERKADAVILVTGIGAAAPAAIAEARQAKVPVFGFRAAHARAGAILAREAKLRSGGFEAGRRVRQDPQGRSGGPDPVRPGSELRQLRESRSRQGTRRVHLR